MVTEVEVLKTVTNTVDTLVVSIVSVTYSVTVGASCLACFGERKRLVVAVIGAECPLLTTVPGTSEGDSASRRPSGNGVSVGTTSLLATSVVIVSQKMSVCVAAVEMTTSLVETTVDTSISTTTTVARCVAVLVSVSTTVDVTVTGSLGGC